MTKLRFILLLIFFLPFMQYGMEKECLNKMSIKYLLNPVETTIFSGSENLLIQSVIDLLRQGNTYKCTFCPQSKTITHRSIRLHFLQFHLKPFQCSKCNGILHIGAPSMLTMGCPKNNYYEHCPMIRDGWINDLENFKSELLHRSTT